MTGRESGPDPRLVLPALAAWGGAFAATEPSSRLRPLLLAAGGLSLLVLAAWSRRVGRVALAGAVLAAAAGGLGVGLLRVRALQAGELPAYARDGATVEALARLTGDPRRVAGQAYGGGRGDALTVAPARLLRVQLRGREITGQVPVVLMARGPGWSALLPGQRVRVGGRLAVARPGEPVAAVVVARGPPQRVGDPPWWQTAAGSLRAGLREAVSGLPPEVRGLLPGLVIGDTTRMPDRLVADFRTAGLTHLTAVSGANLAIVTGAVLLAGRRLGLRGRALPLAALVAMSGFVVLVRPQPSVVRAGVMALIGLAALASGRTRQGLSALAATVLALVLVDPWLARSYGFVLSVLATAALVTLAPAWGRAWHRRGLPGWAAQALAVPLAAQLVCAPVVVLLSGQVSLVAIAANVLAVPVVAPATVLGVLSTVLSVVHPPTAAALAWLAGGCAWWLVRVAHWSAGLPWAALDWPDSAAGAVGLALLTAAGVVAGPALARRPARLAVLLLPLLLWVGWRSVQPGWPAPGWVLAVCDVGQGDALALAAGPARAVVVDTGPDPVLVDRCLRRLGVREVPLLLLTHLHADHAEGVPGVLRGRRVGEVAVGAYDEPAGQLRRVTRWAGRAGVPVTQLRAGDRVRLGPLRWRVLWPARVIDAGSVPNNASVVLDVRSRGLRLLLLGDVEPEAQRAILAGGVGPVDVLKVAHHGSAYQAPELLAATRPRLALISVGVDNGYGHPAAVTLRRLGRVGAVVGRTDRDGTLLVTAPGLRLVTGGR